MELQSSNEKFGMAEVVMVRVKACLYSSFVLPSATYVIGICTFGIGV